MSRIPAETIAAVLADYRDGMAVYKIAARHGVSVETVRVKAREADLPARKVLADAGTPGYCAACQTRAKLDAERLCRRCAWDVPLRDGSWVYDRKRGVQVWVEDGAA